MYEQFRFIIVHKRVALSFTFERLQEIFGVVMAAIVTLHRLEKIMNNPFISPKINSRVEQFLTALEMIGAEKRFL